MSLASLIVNLAKIGISATALNVLGLSVGPNLRRYGGGPGKSAEQNSSAFAKAFSELGGEDVGYGMPAVSIVLDGDVEVADDLVLPVNVSLVSPGFVKLTGPSIMYQNPALGSGSRSYTEYWPWCRSLNRNIDFRLPVKVNAFPHAMFDRCSFGSADGLFHGLNLMNTDGLWTERTTLQDCFLRSGGDKSVLLLDSYGGPGTPGGGTSSFAYTDLQSCIVSMSGDAKLMSTIRGGKLYGSLLNVRGNATGTSTLFHTNDGSMDSNHFNVRVEDDSGEGSPKLFDLNGGEFFDNKGLISLPSFNFSCSDAGGTTYRQNQVLITGASFTDYWDGAFTLSNAQSYTTVAEKSVTQRKPSDLQSVDYFHAGAMTCAINNNTVNASQLLGVLPRDARRIIRAEISARTAPAGNAEGAFYFDLRAGMGGGSFAYPKALTSLALPDGDLLAMINVDIDVSDGSGWVLMAKPTDISPNGSNSGTPPQDVMIRIYYV